VYAALWRSIPGNVFAKIGAMLLLLVSALALLFFVIFPVVEPHLPWNDVTVNTPPVGSLPSIVDSQSPSRPSPSATK
jgi:hypothetical protein